MVYTNFLTRSQMASDFDLRERENIKIISKLHRINPSPQKENFAFANKNLLKSRNWSPCECAALHENERLTEEHSGPSQTSKMKLWQNIWSKL